MGGTGKGEHLLRAIVATLAASALLSLPSSAGAATVFGETFPPSAGCNANETWIQSASMPAGQYEAPISGVITAWTYRATSQGGQLRLKVARPAGGNDFLIVAGSAMETILTHRLNVYPTRIAVQAGDLIGFHTGTNVSCARTGALAAGYVSRGMVGNPAPGEVVTSSPTVNSHLNIGAVLESDADGDGFGDESQDACPGDASQQVPCPAPDPPDTPPETFIVEGPSGKSKSSKATFAFIGVDARAVAGFACKLDKGPYEACASPTTYTGLKKGSHTLEVRALDNAGNGDPTPATRTWMVKKKKK